MTQRTGSKPEYGSEACEFAPLGAGVTACSPMAWKRSRRWLLMPPVVWVTFASAGTGGSGGCHRWHDRQRQGERCVYCGLRDRAAAQTNVKANGSYRFEKLTAGNYTVQC